MISLRCHTNLDLNNECWPTKLPAVPHVGDLIESEVHHKNNFRLELEVVSVTWKYTTYADYTPFIELHLPKGRFLSIKAFYEWYAPIVGRDVAAFI